MGQKDAVTTVKTKIVVVGDCKCGKTAFINRYISKTYTDAYAATGIESYNTVYEVSANYRVELSIWDTSGDSGYDKVRPVSYSGADLFIVCFSIGDPDSLHNIVSKWVPEIREHRPDQPIIIVGCGSDMRSDEAVKTKLARNKLAPVTNEQGLKTAKDIDALVYSETSAKTSESSVRDVVEVAALSSVGTRNHSASDDLKRSKSFIKKKRFSGIGEAKSTLRKEATKSCTIM